MNENDNSPQSSLITYLVGLSLLVFVAVIFSLVFDGSIIPDRNEANLQYRIAREQEYKEGLEMEKQQLLARWKAITSPRIEQHIEFTDTQKLVASLEDKRRRLTLQREQLQTKIREIPVLLVEHRDTYRRDVRNRLKNAKFEELQLNSGRRYQDVIIRGFEDTSIQIAHAGGIARIAMVELPDDWKARIHWGSDEASGISSPLR